MRELPSKFIPKNLLEFSKFKFERDTCYLREAIYEHYLGETKERKFEEFFDLDSFCKQRKVINNADFTRMISIVCDELHKLGWQTKVGHSNTALWIYDNVAPKSIPDW